MWERLDAVVQFEFERVRTLRHGSDLVLTLELNPCFDEILREDTACEQELVISFESR